MRFSCFSLAFAFGLFALVVVSCDRNSEEKSDEIVFKVAERDPRKIGQPQEPIRGIREDFASEQKADTMAEKYPEVSSVVGIVKGVFSESADQVPQQKPVAPEIQQPAAAPSSNDVVATILKNAPAIIDSIMKQRSDGEAGAGAFEALGPEILDSILKNGKEISQEDLDAAQEAMVKYGPVLEDLLRHSIKIANQNSTSSEPTNSSILETILRQLLESGTKTPLPSKSQSNY